VSIYCHWVTDRGVLKPTSVKPSVGSAIYICHPDVLAVFRAARKLSHA
jgi:hypothetical protein